MKNSIKLLVWSVVATVAIVGAVWQYGPCTFPPIPSSSSPIPNAYDSFERAAVGLSRDEQKVRLPSSIIARDYDHYPPSLQIAVLKATAPDLQAVRTGLAYSYGYPQDRSNPQMVFYPSYREMARLLHLQGELAARQADWNGAANSYIDCITLGVLVPHGSPPVGGMLGAACETIGRKSLWSVIPHLSYAQAQSAKLRLLKLESQRVSYLDGQVEQKYSRQALLQTYFRSGNWAKQLAYAEAKYMDGPRRPSDNDLLTLEWRLNIEGKRAVYNQFTNYQNAVIEAARQPYDPHARIKDVPLDPVTAFYYPRFGVDPYSANQFFRVNRIDSQTQNDLLIITLALRQYWLKNHTYPKTLSELTPQYLSTIPADPFAPSGPLRYARVGNAYKLYSIGPDGKDNHGSAVSMGTLGASYLEDTSTGDIVAGINP